MPSARKCRTPTRWLMSVATANLVGIRARVGRTFRAGGWAPEAGREGARAAGVRAGRERVRGLHEAIGLAHATSTARESDSGTVAQKARRGPGDRRERRAVPRHRGPVDCRDWAVVTAHRGDRAGRYFGDLDAVRIDSARLVVVRRHDDRAWPRIEIGPGVAGRSDEEVCIRLRAPVGGARRVARAGLDGAPAGPQHAARREDGNEGAAPSHHAPDPRASPEPGPHLARSCPHPHALSIVRLGCRAGMRLASNIVRKGNSPNDELS